MGNISAAQQTQLQPSDDIGANRLLYLRGSTKLEKRNGGHSVIVPTS